jgi:acyl carrier protein
MSSASVAEQYEKDVIEILGELTADWDDLGLNAPIGPDTAIVAELGFESLDVVYLVTSIEERYGRRDMPFEQLLMVDGSYVTDLTVKQIAQFLQEQIGE